MAEPKVKKKININTPEIVAPEVITRVQKFYKDYEPYRTAANVKAWNERNPQTGSEMPRRAYVDDKGEVAFKTEPNAGAGALKIVSPEFAAFSMGRSIAQAGYRLFPKPNPKAHYRNIGGKEGYTATVKQGEVTSPNLQQPYFGDRGKYVSTKGVPKGTPKDASGRYITRGQHTSPGQNKLGYEGKYFVETQQPMTRSPYGDWGNIPTGKVALNQEGTNIYKRILQIGDREILHKKVYKLGGIMNRSKSINPDKPKASLGAVIGAAAPLIGVGSSIISGILGNRAQKKALRRQQEALDLQTAQQEAASMTQAYSGQAEANREFYDRFKPSFKEGGGIHIKPSKRGTFTAAASKHGMGVQAFASRVMANKENYSPAMVKKANFARNAAKWKHELGGEDKLQLGGKRRYMIPTASGRIPTREERLEKEFAADQETIRRRSTGLTRESIPNAPRLRNRPNAPIVPSEEGINAIYTVPTDTERTMENIRRATPYSMQQYNPNTPEPTRSSNNRTTTPTSTSTYSAAATLEPDNVSTPVGRNTGTGRPRVKSSTPTPATTPTPASTRAERFAARTATPAVQQAGYTRNELSQVSRTVNITDEQRAANRAALEELKNKKAVGGQVSIQNGGDAKRLGGNSFLLRGNKHSQGGIDLKVGNRTIEAEGGEVVKVDNNKVKILSAQPILGGKSPASIAQSNPSRINEAFNKQEAYKRRKGLKDDGTKAQLGLQLGRLMRDEQSIQNTLSRATTSGVGGVNATTGQIAPVSASTSGNATTGGSSFGNFLSNNAAELISGAGSILSGVLGLSAANRTPAPKRPSLLSAAKLRTTYNIAPQEANIARQANLQRNAIRQGTASSNVALNRLQTVGTAETQQRNQLQAQKENIETQLINQNAMNQQAVSGQNIQALNEWQNAKTNFAGQRIAAQTNAVNQMIRGVSDATSDIQTRQDKQDYERRSLALFAAGDVNNNFGRIIESGYFDRMTNNDRKTLNSLYNTSNNEDLRKMIAEKLGITYTKKG